jgi:transcriptional regulator with XRE-family HTH domain
MSYRPENAKRVMDKMSGQTLQAMSSKVGVTKSQMCRVLQGKRSPSVELVLRLSTAYRVDMGDMLHYLALRVQEARTPVELPLGD